MNIQDVTIYVLEENLVLRESVQELLGAMGGEGKIFSSPQDLLRELQCASQPGIVILNAHFSELSGLDVMTRICQTSPRESIIFYSEVPDVQTGVAAIKRGAIDFLITPLSQPDLQGAVMEALAKLEAHRKQNGFLESSQEMYARLTRREKEVFELAASGYLNKQIASRLGIAEKTVKIHRSRVMSKLQLSSIAQLVQFYLRLQPDPVVNCESGPAPA